VCLFVCFFFFSFFSYVVFNCVFCCICCYYHLWWIKVYHYSAWKPSQGGWTAESVFGRASLRWGGWCLLSELLEQDIHTSPSQLTALLQTATSPETARGMLHGRGVPVTLMSFTRGVLRVSSFTITHGALPTSLLVWRVLFRTAFSRITVADSTAKQRAELPASGLRRCFVVMRREATLVVVKADDNRQRRRRRRGEGNQRPLMKF